MAQRAIRECDGKKMLSRWMQSQQSQHSQHSQYSQQSQHSQHSQQSQHTQRNRMEDRFVQVTPDTPLDDLATTHPWLQQEKLVVKPDQLIKRRGKSGLILLEATWQQAQTWIQERMGQPIEVEGISGILDHFIIEPFTPHAPEDEYYLAIRSTRDGDEILFYHEGGIHVGDVDAKATRLLIPIGDTPTRDEMMRNLVAKAPEYCRPLIAGFVEMLFRFYAQLHYTYLEINPFVVVGEYIVPLDMAARIDDTAEFVCGHLWGTLEFPAPFGRKLRPEEKHIVELDAQTGASLKLTILNPHGRVWTMVAGGGASVIYADTVTDLGFSAELANYGEYSGDPSEQFTCEYARTILDLMTREQDPRGKVLIIGGGIANFTDVASTFKGIVRALKEYQQKLIDHQVKLYVRRGGPNYQDGLRVMRELGQTLGVPIAVYGPETHITSIVPMALGVGEYAA